MNILVKIIILLIRFYQKTLSPDHGWLKAKYPAGYCKFYPSCSQYSAEALERFGLFKGLYLGIKRVLRCHPWASPKFDPVPNK